jgi:hypothetical protein
MLRVVIFDFRISHAELVAKRARVAELRVQALECRERARERERLDLQKNL